MCWDSFSFSVIFVLKFTFASLNIVQKRCLTFENIILCRLLNSSARFQLFYWYRSRFSFTVWLLSLHVQMFTANLWNANCDVLQAYKVWNETTQETQLPNKHITDAQFFFIAFAQVSYDFCVYQLILFHVGYWLGLFINSPVMCG